MSTALPPIRKLGGGAYVLGGLSFIPLVGIAFGIVAIIWGFTTTKIGGKKLALLGALGIGFSVVLYGGLFYFGFVQRGGIYDELRVRLAQSTLDSLVQAIEFYRLEHGHYPDSLVELQKSFPKNSFLMIYDPTFTKFGATPRYFYYKHIDKDHYYLRGVGADGKPFTADDIVPNVVVGPGSGIGLLKDPPTIARPLPH